VVGLLIAALYSPLWRDTILGPADFAVALVAFLLLTVWNVPSWAVVLLGVAESFLL
jgi:chromate transporter